MIASSGVKVRSKDAHNDPRNPSFGRLDDERPRPVELAARPFQWRAATEKLIDYIDLGDLGDTDPA